jgi:dCTP deaminase
MILTGSEIVEQRRTGRIRIDPFYPEQISPNSYDFRLGDAVEMYESDVLDFQHKSRKIKIAIPDEGLVLKTDKIYLACTEELIGSDHFAAIVHARSSVARMGLFVHVTADLIDIGTYDRWILQLHAVQPVRIFRGMRIGQVTFWSVMGGSNGRKGNNDP